MNKIYHLAICSIILCLAFSMHGQSNYREGFVITLDNDSLKGLIHDGGHVKNARFCQFKENPDSETKVFYPSEIKSYYSENFFYVSKTVKIGDKFLETFMECLVDGMTDLYYLRTANNSYFFIQQDNGPLIELINRHEEMTLSVEGGNRPVNNQTIYIHFLSYIDTLKSVFSDSDINEEVIENTKFNRKSLIHITRLYNDSKCEVNCVEYVKDMSQITPNFGIFSGVQSFSISKYKISGVSDIRTVIPIGIFYNSGIPSRFNRFSYQIECIYMGFDNLNGKFSVYDENDYTHQSPGTWYHIDLDVSMKSLFIPVYLKYQHAFGKLAPSIGAGIENRITLDSQIKRNIDIEYDNTLEHYSSEQFNLKPYQLNWLLNLGLSYKLTGRTSIFANARIQPSTYRIYDIPGRSIQFRNVQSISDVPGNHYFTSLSYIFFLGVEF